MHFLAKSTLKNNRYHITKYIRNFEGSDLFVLDKLQNYSHLICLY